MFEKSLRCFLSAYLAYALSSLNGTTNLCSLLLLAPLIWLVIHIYENPYPDRAKDAARIGQAIRDEIEKKIDDAN